MQPDPTLTREVFKARYEHDEQYRNELQSTYEHALTDLTCDLYDEVADERAFQLAKFGNEIIDPFVALAVIDEEKGEASKAALENDWANHRAELLQTAVSALKAVQNIDRMLINKAIGLRAEPHDCCSPCSDPKCPWPHHAPLKPEDA